MRSSILDSPWFESRHLPNCVWDVLKEVQRYRSPWDNPPAPIVSNSYEFPPDDGTCPIMDLSDEILLLVFENVQFSPENYTSIACVNERFNSLVRDTHLGYQIATLQFPPYTKLLENAWRRQEHKSNAGMKLLYEVYDMHRMDAVIINLVKDNSGHSSQVSMTLIVLLKMIMSEFPQAVGTRTRADMVDPLERYRIVLFRLLVARAYLSPEALILMRYTVETIRQGMSRHASTLVRSGWLTSEPPLDFTYYAFFEDCLLRNHATFVWKVPIMGSTQELIDQLERIDVFAKMFERQEEFLGQDPIDYEDDISWAAMMTTHHEWGRALWPDLTVEQKEMIQQQALFPELPEEEKAASQYFPFDVYEGGILQIGNLNLADDGLYLPTASPTEDDADLASAQLPPTPVYSERLYKTDEVHEHLMLLTRTKYADKDCMERALESLDMAGIRDKIRKGREMVWSMSLEQCIQAVAREVETSELRYWLSGSME